MDNKQLYEKTNQEYRKFYPLTDILSIIDKESGKNLKQLLNQYNHIKLDWKGNTVDTRNSVPLILRHKGLFVTYDNGTSIVTEFYKGEDISVSINSIWQNDNNWTDLSPGASLADNEDIAEIDGKFKFADRNYNPAQFTGMGRVILRKNLVDVGGGTVKNVLTQDMINKSNTIYEIRYDFDLNGEEVTIPESCVLDFQGGSLNNGNITFNNTAITGIIKFDNIAFRGTISRILDYRKGVFDLRIMNINNGDDITSILQNALDNDNINEVIIPSGYYIISSTIIVPQKKKVIMQSHQHRYMSDAVDVQPNATRLISSGITNGYMFELRDRSSLIGGALLTGNDMDNGGAILINIGKYRISSVYIKTDLCIYNVENYLLNSLTAIFIDGNYKSGGDSLPRGENFIFDINITGFNKGVYFERLNENDMSNLVWFNGLTIDGWMSKCQRYIYSNVNSQNHAGSNAVLNVIIQGAEVNDNYTPAVEWGGDSGTFNCTFFDISKNHTQKIRYKLTGNNTTVKKVAYDESIIVDFTVGANYYFEKGPIIETLNNLSADAPSSITFGSGYIVHDGNKHTIFLNIKLNGNYTYSKLLDLRHKSSFVVRKEYQLGSNNKKITLVLSDRRVDFSNIEIYDTWLYAIIEYVSI